MADFTAGEITELVSGSTLYHRPALGSSHGNALIPMYFAADGRMSAAIGGRVRKARWTAFAGGYQLDWDDGLQGSRSLVERRAGSLVAINAKDGTLRTIIERVEEGDPETLGIQSDASKRRPLK